ncbi:UNVERIFIED_CONTAM: DNA gyrase subunit A [Campylobacter lari]
MSFDEKEKTNLEPSVDEYEEYDNEDQSDELFVAFKKEKHVEEDEGEDIPQNKPEYRVQPQILYEEKDGIKPMQISTEMKNSFMEYAMSVIVSRALPDARDGLKPVHRRILYDMNELKIDSSSQHRKSARIVGDVLGKYHPHGDSSVYEAMVRMAQDFSMRYPLVDGHGNFGSIDGDEAAAMRYTEARLSKLASEMLDGINKNTVNFVDNYDASELEPSVLPSRFPNLLVSGGSGIAVGLATSIPPHNLGETIDATIAFARNNDITIDELMEYIPGPDFPTGAMIIGKKGIKDAYHTGRGSIPVRSVADIKTFQNGKSQIIVTEIPYQLNKSSLITRMSELIKNKVITGIADIRDESNREGIRIVIDIKKGENADIILNKLYRHSPLQSNFSVNFVALVNGEPKLLNLKDAISVYLKHQEDVVSRRLKFDLQKSEDRLHIVEGLIVAVDNIDEVIAIIKSSKGDQEAQAKLMERFNLTEIQTKYIIDMRLGRLTSSSISKLVDEKNELVVEIARIKNILENHNLLIDLIVSELEQIKDKYGDKRRTKIDTEASISIEDEDLIVQKDIVITTSTNGFVKRMNLDEYKTQRRGGVGFSTMKTYEDDDIASILTTTTHTDLLLFSNIGKVYRIRAHQIPEQSRQSKGTSFVNIIPSLKVDEGEKIVSMLSVDSYDSDKYLFTTTKKGIIKKTSLDNYERINQGGKYAFNLIEDDELIRAQIIDDNNIILLANSEQRVVKFPANDFRAISRTATGVRGIKLEDNQSCISASSDAEGELILTIGKLGYGKLTHHSLFRLVKRGAKGSIGINNKLAGDLVFARFVNPDDEIIIITSTGLTIRTFINQISETSRNAKGVKLINLKNNEVIQAVEIIKTDSKTASEEELASSRAYIEKMKQEANNSLENEDNEVEDTDSEDDE